MEPRDIEYRVGDLDGCRLIETVWPKRSDMSRLAASISEFYSLWGDGQPTVFLTDTSQLENYDAEVHAVLGVLLKRVLVDPDFVAGVWVVGTNEVMTTAIERTVAEAGRTPTTIYADRSDAIAHLRAVIASTFST